MLTPTEKVGKSGCVVANKIASAVFGEFRAMAVKQPGLCVALKKC